MVLADVLLTVVPLLAALPCWYAARRAKSSRVRYGWYFVGGGCALWGLGQGAWTYVEVILQAEPFPSVADVGYVGFLVFGAIGLGAFLGFGRSNLVGLRSVLDGAIIASGCLFILWVFVLGDVFNSSELDGFGRGLALAYPLGDIVLLTVAVLVLARAAPAFGEMFRFVLLGIVLVTMADLAFAYLSLQDLYLAGQLVDVGWLAGFGLIGVAALHPQALASPPDTAAWSPTRFGSVLPYVVLIAVLLAAAAEMALRGALEPLLIWIGIAFTAFVIGRQILLGLDNVRLVKATASHVEALKRSEEKRIQLLNTISHDLANPVNPIKIQAAVLMMGDLSPDHRRSVESIDRNARLLERLVGDIKDLAKVEAHRVIAELRPTQLDIVVRDAVEAFRPEAQTRGIDLLVEGTSGEIAADAQRLTQVATNLVSNALKFTPRGGRVVVRMMSTPTSVVLEVQDTGRGLTEPEAARLFQPFVQVHQRGEIPERGTGLGLYITRTIVEAHGGRIGVQSDGHGRGSRFRLEMPLLAAHMRTTMSQRLAELV